MPVRWSRAAKDGVGTAFGTRSRVWFTLADGIVTEVFYPSVDRANTRSLRTVVSFGGLVIVDGSDGDAIVSAIEPWLPAYNVRSRHADGALTIHKTIITDTSRPVLLHRVRLEWSGERPANARAFVLIEPHLANNGGGNDAWLGEYKGRRALLARRRHAALALLCSRTFASGACTYAGGADALADLRAHGRLTRVGGVATNGNLQIAAEIALDDTLEWTIALGFGESPDYAAQAASASLLVPFERMLHRYAHGWRRYHRRHPITDEKTDASIATVHAASLSMLRVHGDKERTGAIIASLAIPWGDAHGDHNAGGYHLVWPRDLVEAAGALLAVGDAATARRTLMYLMSTQEASGIWPQNMWLDGTPFLRGIQLDEVALPILLAGLLERHRALSSLDPWPMIRAAAAYLVRHGPMTPQDRWEEEGGYSPYTIAAQVAALVAAGRFAEGARQPALARFFVETADYWNASIERWMYVTDTPTARRHGVGGYYVRLTPPDAIGNDSRPRLGTPLRIVNQRCAETTAPYEEIVSPDALALVRFGLRRADDPRIRDTIGVIDAELETQTVRGPVWHRYTHDGYGERADGAPHLGWGIGRGWPLLAGERAHYELANQRLDDARRLHLVMTQQANQTGLLPEQVWDVADIPERGLFNGRPSGSAMPLVWAHAEFLKLSRSIRDGRVFDLPTDTADRYLAGARPCHFMVWRADQILSRIPRGLTLRVEASASRAVHWWVPGDDRRGLVAACDLGSGIVFADLPTAELPRGAEICFSVDSDTAPEREHRVTIV